MLNVCTFTAPVLRAMLRVATAPPLVRDLQGSCKPPELPTCLQFVVGFPLLLPFKVLHPPSIFIYQAVSHGKGKYIGGTITAIATLVMLTSIYEAVTLEQELKNSDGKCVFAWSLLACCS